LPRVIRPTIARRRLEPPGGARAAGAAVERDLLHRGSLRAGGETRHANGNRLPANSKPGATPVRTDRFVETWLAEALAPRLRAKPPPAGAS
jgi:hypothetical protein